MSKRGAIERLVSRVMLLLLLDGAKAEEHPIKAAMNTAESSVLVIVSIAGLVPKYDRVSLVVEARSKVLHHHRTLACRRQVIFHLQDLWLGLR